MANSIGLGSEITSNNTQAVISAGADVLKLNGAVVLNPFSLDLLVNGIGPVGEVQVNGVLVANNPACMVELAVNLTTVPLRAFSVVYQNTTGFPLLVIINCSNGSANSTLSVVSDTTPNPSTQVWTKITGNSANFNDSATYFFVLPGGYYKVTETGTPAVQTWREFICKNGAFSNSGDIVGSKALSTVYTNNTNNLKFISVQLTGVSSASAVQGLSDSQAIPTDVVDSQQQVSSGTGTVTLFFLVPAGQNYKVTAASGSLLHWYEYSWSIPCTKSLNLSSSNSEGKTRRQSSWQSGFGFIANGGGSASLASFPITWLNSSNRVMWLQFVSSIATANNQVALITGDGIPPQSPLAVEGMITSGAPRTIRGPIMPGKSYTVWDTQGNSGNITSTSWFEYQIG